MAEKDLREKNLIAIPEIFADIYNGFNFYGNTNKIIDPLCLDDLPTEGIYYDVDGNVRNMFQDTFKEYKKNKLALVQLGMEYQSEIDRTMPVRIMGYKYTGYKRQVDDYIFRRKFLLEMKNNAETPETKKVYEEDLKKLGKLELTPVLILVLNFSGRTWNVPKSLKDMVNDDNPYKDDMDQLSIKVIDIHLLKEEDCQRFKSDFGAVVRFLNAKEKNYDGILQELKYPVEVLGMLNSIKNIKNYEEVREIIINNKKEGKVVNMGTLIDTMYAEGKAEGKAEGEARRLAVIVERYMERHSMTAEEACEELGESYEEYIAAVELLSVNA